MPLPLFLGIGAAIAGVTGLGAGIRGGLKMKEAKETMGDADSQHKKNVARFEEENKKTSGDMDNLGTKEMEILKSFEDFQNVFEMIHNRPEFNEVQKNGVDIPKYNKEELQKVSIGAGVLLGGLGGASLGVAGGFAAAGATTSAVMALGTASTGTAISALSGAAATNATLAALGGGAIAAGGGGIALGTTILGAATAGVGLLIGGIIFSVAGGSLSKKADEAWDEMKKAEKEINRICEYLSNLSAVSVRYLNSLKKVEKGYNEHLDLLKKTVITDGKQDWRLFTDEEKLITENTVMLVGLLYEMCKVQLVLQSDKKDDLNTINYDDVNDSIIKAETFLNVMKS